MKDHCVISACCNFRTASAVRSSRLASNPPRTRSISSVRTRCCMPDEPYEPYNGSDTVIPRLIPKPMPRPQAPEKQEQTPSDEAYKQKRMLAYLSGLAPRKQEVLDPNSDNFRSEMRKRLLFTEPPPLEEFSMIGSAEEEVEFDVFEHLVLTIRYILHLRYKIGQRLQYEDELILREEAIPYHPDRDEKVGCGIEYIKVDIHPEFGSRCFFIVREDESEIDFSYRKCMMGLARAKSISEERAMSLIYFFRTTNGQRLPVVKSWY